MVAELFVAVIAHDGFQKSQHGLPLPVQEEVENDRVQGCENEGNDAGSSVDSRKYRLIGVSFEVQELKTAGEHHREILVEYYRIEIVERSMGESVPQMPHDEVVALILPQQEVEDQIDGCQNCESHPNVVDVPEECDVLVVVLVNSWSIVVQVSRQASLPRVRVYRYVLVLRLPESP